MLYYSVSQLSHGLCVLRAEFIRYGACCGGERMILTRISVSWRIKTINIFRRMHCKRLTNMRIVPHTHTHGSPHSTYPSSTCSYYRASSSPPLQPFSIHRPSPLRSKFYLFNRTAPYADPCCVEPAAAFHSCLPQLHPPGSLPSSSPVPSEAVNLTSIFCYSPSHVSFTQTTTILRILNRFDSQTATQSLSST